MLAVEHEPDAGAVLLILAMVGGYFILLGFLHFLLWIAWKLHFPMPGWMREHLHDEWGQK